MAKLSRIRHFIPVIIIPSKVVQFLCQSRQLMFTYDFAFSIKKEPAEYTQPHSGESAGYSQGPGYGGQGQGQNEQDYREPQLGKRRAPNQAQFHDSKVLFSSGLQMSC